MQCSEKDAMLEGISARFQGRISADCTKSRKIKAIFCTKSRIFESGFCTKSRIYVMMHGPCPGNCPQMLPPEGKVFMLKAECAKAFLRNIRGVRQKIRMGRSEGFHQVTFVVGGWYRKGQKPVRLHLECVKKLLIPSIQGVPGGSHDVHVHKVQKGDLALRVHCLQRPYNFPQIQSAGHMLHLSVTGTCQTRHTFPCSSVSASPDPGAGHGPSSGR